MSDPYGLYEVKETIAGGLLLVIYWAPMIALMVGGGWVYGKIVEPFDEAEMWQTGPGIGCLPRLAIRITCVILMPWGLLYAFARWMGWWW